MKGSTQSIYSIFIASLALIIFTSACNFGAEPVNKPIVKVELPQSETGFVVGQAVVMQVLAADAKGVARIELEIDGAPFITVPAGPAETSFIFSQPWLPSVAGSHVILARAYNIDEQASEPTTVVVNVVNVENAAQPEAETAAAGDGAPPVVSGDERVADAIGASAGDSINPVVPSAAIDGPDDTTSPADTPPMATMLVNLNVRTGPGVQYPIIGQFVAGQSALITAKNPEGTWYQIIFPANSNSRGWVASSTQYVSGHNTQNVPITAVPLPPSPTPFPTATPATPLPTATPPTHTPTPPALPADKPVIYSFTANQYTITAGESVVLQWDLANAQVAYLHYNGTQEGVVSPGSKMVSPAATTVYTLIAHNDAGDTYAQIEVVVNPVVNPDGGDGPFFPMPLPTIVITPFPAFPLPTSTPHPGPFEVLPIPGLLITPQATLELMPIPGFMVTPQPTFEIMPMPGFIIPSP